MSTRANSLLYLVLRYRGPARVDGDTLARRRQKCKIRDLAACKTLGRLAGSDFGRHTAVRARVAAARRREKAMCWVAT